MRAIPTLDAIDTRLVFKVYGAALITLGVFGVDGNFLIPREVSERLMPAWLVTHPSRATEFGWYVVPRVLGCAFLLLGIVARGLAKIEDDVARQRMLVRFAVAHLVFAWPFQGVTSAIIGDAMPDWVPWAPLIVAGVLGYCALAAARFTAGAATLRSQYEEQIRLATRREERARFARDLHDAVKQQLFVVQTSAATVEARLDSDRDAVQTAMESVREAARAAMSEMDALIGQLQAPPLTITGLVDALRTQCDALGFRTGAEVRLDVGQLPANDMLPPGGPESLYRLAQEALANVGRHARAEHVTVFIGVRTQALDLTVTDDGVGYHPGTVEGYGQRSMSDRARELGGRCEFTSVPGHGAAVRLTVPCLASTATQRLVRVAAWAGGITLGGLMLFGSDGRAPEFFMVVALVLTIGVLIGATRVGRAYVYLHRHRG
jgi:signal transduction histidine kinase